MTLDPTVVQSPLDPNEIQGMKIRLLNGMLAELEVERHENGIIIKAVEANDPHSPTLSTAGRKLGYLDESDLVFTYRTQLILSGKA